MSTEHVPDAHHTFVPHQAAPHPAEPHPAGPHLAAPHLAAPHPGAPHPGVPHRGVGGHPASIGDRFLARLIDGVAVFAGAVPFVLLGNALAVNSEGAAVMPYLIGLVIYFGYEFVATGLFGQTVGKRVMRLRVVALDGRPAGWGSSAARVYVPMAANLVTCGLAGFLFYLSPLFDGSVWRRGWYDQIASTVVISGKAPTRPWYPAP
jgi:uncharacterized RDD family membrane protein YckC